MILNQDFVNELRKHFTGDIRLDLGSRILYSTDASIYQIEPLGVVIPRSEDDLQATVELASKYHIPILPRGSGSSLAGQAIGEALILDCSRWLDRIIEINPETKSAVVEPGVVLTNLNRAAGKFNLQFGPDPASADRATMGGVIANNATGAHSILYGMTVDHLISVDVIHADGSLATWQEIDAGNLELESASIFSSIISAAFNIRADYSDSIKSHFPKSWRNSAGYRLNYLLPWSPSMPPQWNQRNYPEVNPDKINLANLMAGSEGTLGIIRRASINLVPKPKYTILGILDFRSIAEACDAVPDLLKYAPSAIELIPQLILRLARSVPAYAGQMGWVRPGDDGSKEPPALLVVEFTGDDPVKLRESIVNLGRNVVIIEPVEEQARVWNIRKVGLGILDSRPQSARPVAFIEDCAIPVDRLGEFVREIERILAQHKTECGIYAHASAGCLHIRPILDLRTGDGIKSLREIAEQTLALTLRLGGSMSSEHGDGIARGEWLNRTYTEELVSAMRSLKKAADPQGLLNPQKMFDSPPMDTHLRYGPDYEIRSWSPALDFERNGGIVTAIEQCNGQGVCRKEAGVMCPSFQATRDEKYSTRGRSNLLRSLIRAGGRNRKFSDSERQRSDSRANQTNLVLSLELNDNKELSQDVFDALDLCLACKGCKAECPSGVDMAKLKYAFLAEYYKNHPRLLRDYFFGYFYLTAGMLSLIAPLVNFITGVEGIRKLLARMLKITPDRPFPRFSLKKAKVKSNPEFEKVLFLRDPFTHNLEPDVEQAAFDILFAMGFNVEVLSIVGAGASLMSKGFVSAARRHAGHMLDELNKRDPHHLLSIVCIEPSELYTFKHDYSDLVPERHEEIASRTDKTWLIEEFLVRLERFNKLRVANNGIKILFHPHCHQKAEGPSDDGQPNAGNASIKFLQLVGYEVGLIEAGCCGMAGTFGYDIEHFSLSQQIGALKLFPFINQHENEGLVAATGAACRMQIEQGTGVVAQHPVLFAKQAIRNHTPDSGI
jgi:FAD/FMN-containing dehydrogenase/Fe-S oxidoreductase